MFFLIILIFCLFLVIELDFRAGKKTGGQVQPSHWTEENGAQRS